MLGGVARGTKLDFVLKRFNISREVEKNLVDRFVRLQFPYFCLLDSLYIDERNDRLESVVY